MKLAAKWTNDCGGKKDYDGDILSVSTRYYPADGGFYVSDEHGFRKNDILSAPSAHASLLLWNGADGTRKDTGGDYRTLAEAKVQGETFEAVAAQVEQWAQAVTDRAVTALEREFGSEGEPGAGEARLRELAREAAKNLHYNALMRGGWNTGHIDDGTVTMGFEKCPHPDCVLVRAALAQKEQP